MKDVVRGSRIGLYINMKGSGGWNVAFMDSWISRTFKIMLCTCPLISLVFLYVNYYLVASYFCPIFLVRMSYVCMVQSE